MRRNIILVAWISSSISFSTRKKKEEIVTGLLSGTWEKVVPDKTRNLDLFLSCSTDLRSGCENKKEVI